MQNPNRILLKIGGILFAYLMLRRISIINRKETNIEVQKTYYYQNGGKILGKKRN